MYLIDGTQSTVVPFTVGTGDVTKGDLVVWAKAIQWLSGGRRQNR